MNPNSCHDCKCCVTGSNEYSHFTITGNTEIPYVTKASHSQIVKEVVRAQNIHHIKVIK